MIATGSTTSSLRPARSFKRIGDIIVVDDNLLSAASAAQRLGITVTTLYDWLGLSDRGLLKIRELSTAIDYLQTGPRGQGKIMIEAGEVQRLRELLRVRPQTLVPRRTLKAVKTFPGITVPLGRPSV